MSNLHDPKIEEKPAAQSVRMHRVKYEITYTKNLGNFESSKVSVGLEQENWGDPSVTFGRVRQWVEENMETAVKEVNEALGG